MHVHVAGAGGEAKFWLEPAIELAMSSGIVQHELNDIKRIIEEHKDELANAWREHLGA